MCQMCDAKMFPFLNTARDNVEGSGLTSKYDVSGVGVIVKQLMALYCMKTHDDV